MNSDGYPHVLLRYANTISAPKKLTIVSVALSRIVASQFDQLPPKNLTSLNRRHPIDLPPGPYQRCFEVSERQLAPE
jgi:hypothetical protein